MVPEEDLLETLASVGLVRDQEAQVPPDGEGPEVERPVMEDAQGQAVGLGIRTARLVPADVGGVEGHQAVA